jgi:hypothetical protein
MAVCLSRLDGSTTSFPPSPVVQRSDARTIGHTLHCRKGARVCRSVGSISGDWNTSGRLDRQSDAGDGPLLVCGRRKRRQRISPGVNAAPWQGTGDSERRRRIRASEPTPWSVGGRWLKPLLVVVWRWF